MIRTPGSPSYHTLAVLLAALSMVSPFSIDTFFPSFRAISAQFNLTSWEIQQTLTVYMLPYAVMALVHGPLSDVLGRRPVILVGLSLYALASVACTFAPNFATLLIFRALQGMTAGTGLVVGRAIIRDLHDGPQAQRLMSLVTMIFGLAPAIAPILGGWIHVAFGWRSVFGFMVLFGLALVVASRLYLPETHPQEKRASFSVRGLVRTSWQIARHREFLPLALAGGANFATILAFIGAAPALVLDHWGLKETQFHWLFVPIIGGFTTAAWYSGKLAGRMAPQLQTVLGFSFTLAGSALMALVAATIASPPIYLQQLLLAIAAAGVQLVFPVITLRMLDLFPQARGSAASVQSFMSLLIASGVIGFVVPVLQVKLVYLALGALTGTVLAIVLWGVSRRMAQVEAC